MHTPPGEICIDTVRAMAGYRGNGRGRRTCGPRRGVGNGHFRRRLFLVYGTTLRCLAHSGCNHFGFYRRAEGPPRSRLPMTTIRITTGRIPWAIKYYCYSCGRDQRLEELWGKQEQ